MEDEKQVEELEEEIEKFNEMLDDTSSEEQNIIEYEVPVQEETTEEVEEVPEGVEDTSTDNSFIEEVSDNKDIKDNKNNKKKYIIIGIIVLIILLIIISCLIFIKPKKNTVVKEDTLTEEEYKKILDKYADATNLAIDNYMKENNNTIPSFIDIEDIIYYPNYDIKCEKSIINYDGSLYLDNCSIKGIKSKYKYTYGELKEEPEESKTEIYIYQNIFDNSNYYYASNSKYDFEEEYPKLVDTYYCSSDNCIGYQSNASNNKEVVIYDDGYYLYNPNSKDKTKLNGVGNSKYLYVDMITDKNNDSYALYFQKDDGVGAFYLIKKDKFVTDFSYDGNTTTSNMINKGYFAAIVTKRNTSQVVLLNQTTGEVVKTFKDALYITDEVIDGTDLYFVGNSTFGERTGYFLNSNFDKIIKDYDSYLFSINSNNTITIKGKKDFSVYNIDGSKIVSSPKYDEVLKVVKDYIIVKDGAEIDIVDLGGRTLSKICDDKASYTYHTLISGWYEENGKNGVFLVVEDTSVVDGEEGRGLEYYFVPDTLEVGVIKTTGIGGYAKPVLYLYPTKKTKVSVTFSDNNKLTTTYPKYNKKWEVTALSNGDLYDKTGKYYYGLYWEEEGSNDVDFTTGFYVTKKDALEFLDNITEKIGFTRREANEFIMYWLPILEKNEKNLVYFEFTEERDSYNKINITPKPDSLLRVAIHVKKTDKYTNIKEEKIPTFKRSGFTAVEWGGVIH